MSNSWLKLGVFSLVGLIISFLILSFISTNNMNMQTPMNMQGNMNGVNMQGNMNGMNMQGTPTAPMNGMNMNGMSNNGQTMSPPANSDIQSQLNQMQQQLNQMQQQMQMQNPSGGSGSGGSMSGGGMSMM